MPLSSELISEFAKITKDDNAEPSEKVVYGTIVERDGQKYIQIDGSDMVTPVSFTTSIANGERVTAMIKNHTVTVTGNLSSPSVRTAELEGVNGTITKLETSIIQNAAEIELRATKTEVTDIVNDSIAGVNGNISNLGTLITTHETLIQQNAEAIKLRATKTEVTKGINDAVAGVNNNISNLGSTVSTHETLIRQNAEAIELKANKTDPASGVQTSTVSVNSNGVSIATGGTFTVDSGNFELDSNGNLSAQNAYLSGYLFSNGHPVLSNYDISIGTNPPTNPRSRMIWIRPNASASSSTTFTKQITWGDRQQMVNNKRTGTLTGTATAAVGTTYTYRIRIPVYIRTYSSGTTGGVLHFDVATVSGGAAALQASKNVTITEYGSGNRVVEIILTSGTWLGGYGSLYFTLYVTQLSGYYAYNILNSSDSAAAITLECISTSSAGATGWLECQVFSYA